jgi:hypothetical protein
MIGLIYKLLKKTRFFSQAYNTLRKNLVGCEKHKTARLTLRKCVFFEFSLMCFPSLPWQAIVFCERTS